jgi:hypothetical protein
MKKLQLIFVFLMISFSIKAQDVAMNIGMTTSDNISYNQPINIVPVIESTEYTYKYKGSDVLVVYAGNKHIEYFNDKKYYIISNLEWITEDECTITIQESNLPKFPFKTGDKLHMKINKIKNGYVYYESSLGGRSWTGKMKKIN